MAADERPSRSKIVVPNEIDQMFFEAFREVKQTILAAAASRREAQTQSDGIVALTTEDVLESARVVSPEWAATLARVVGGDFDEDVRRAS